ncbi:hypothetical protein EXU57_03030 [Segetibacter sp. 3557_3]|uniref:hypothetical protein n=1 Tax=Segetibacter sp. 3557_3 TaxID=2547429 RepID=UPI0010590871|nr:hypothetical protein [Segetibacter sp. 3557_3]TDH29060.1 hypothetical protein EXU57_03030 [Segetibacter sp. 3557_3]
MITVVYQPNETDDVLEEDSDLEAIPGQDDLEEDGTPVLDEEDLEENDLTVEEADEIEWDEPK